MSFNIQSFRCTYNTITYTVYMAHSRLLFPPLAISFAPLCVPFVSPSTYLAPSSCDRNRPPFSQVACKLTPFAPPFTQLTHPSQIPRTPPTPRLSMTTSGIFRLLLIGTLLPFLYDPLLLFLLCYTFLFLSLSLLLLFLLSLVILSVTLRSLLFYPLPPPIISDYNPSQYLPSLLIPLYTYNHSSFKGTVSPDYKCLELI
jgi:hypothetical protein